MKIGVEGTGDAAQCVEYNDFIGRLLVCSSGWHCAYSDLELITETAAEQRFQFRFSGIFRRVGGARTDAYGRVKEIKRDNSEEEAQQQKY